MTHLITIILEYTELKQLFDSAHVQTLLKETCQKTTGDEPFYYMYTSLDDPSEIVALVYIFPDADTVWVDLLVIDGKQYKPKSPPFGIR